MKRSKILNVLLFPLVIVVFSALGIYAGPYARAAYAKLFPEPDYEVGNFSEILKTSDKTVVLFSTSTCPYCAQTRDFLEKEGVAYKDYVLDKSPDGVALYDSLGEKAVPILVIGARKIKGFKPDAIKEAVQAL